LSFAKPHHWGTIWVKKYSSIGTSDMITEMISINKNVHLHRVPLRLWCVGWHKLMCIFIEVSPVKFLELGLIPVHNTRVKK
jgi:hypothetical protein